MFYINVLIAYKNVKWTYVKPKNISFHVPCAIKDNIDAKTSETLLLCSSTQLISFLCSLDEMVHLWASESC